MNKYVVTARKMPTNYNSPVCFVVEAATEDDARIIVKHELRDLSDSPVYSYRVAPYVLPPSGTILSHSGSL